MSILRDLLNTCLIRSYKYWAHSGTAVMLCNLGTPDEPTAAATRRYLAQFLSDRRVVEIPAFLWKPILHGVILRTRPAKSAAKYQTVWTPEGSPLRVWTERQAKLLAGALGERGLAVPVRPAMRYGLPSIPAALDALRADGAQRVLVLPAYPQYCASTTASSFDAVANWAKATRSIPALRFVGEYHQHPGYIGALANSVREYWGVHGKPDRLVMSFHGMPQRTVALGDPYQSQCLATARLLADRLSLADDAWCATFQSRFGRAAWLQPYTEPTLRQLARQGVRRVDVMCPGFVADCLETLEEIAMECREAFLHDGGSEYHYIPCLNARPDWMKALTDIAQTELMGWPTERAA